MGVKVREKRGKLYLDVYHNGRRKWEALGLTVPADETQRAEIMKLAETCRCKKEMGIAKERWGVD